MTDQSWRENYCPSLQPNLAAGCTAQTPLIVLVIPDGVGSEEREGERERERERERDVHYDWQVHVHVSSESESVITLILLTTIIKFPIYTSTSGILDLHSLKYL